jgi:sulfite exporter TauE/SafE
MVAWALATIAATFGARTPGTLAPEWTKRALGGALLAMRDRPPTVRAALTGLLTTLLPCGWLYAFAATAAGSGSVAGGALVMAVFWAGTVPMMLGVGLGAQRLLSPVARRLPVVGAVAVLVLGLLSISGKMRAPAAHAAHAPAAMERAAPGHVAH